VQSLATNKKKKKIEKYLAVPSSLGKVQIDEQQHRRQYLNDALLLLIGEGEVLLEDSLPANQRYMYQTTVAYRDR
jgi:hypothetical protein